ncbi:hypothetical protein [Spelaeicoccus albus]|uniref:ABC-type Na+ efflux pump permease subunit n=1 Tax=Spelaeicoccus albus TaxID=1280376 RepID=A0A7Z0A7J4_9MICO|nr:hypothetical protein [Spelaeicoccus albus]NYI65879.1 ABC-type Na+ efflux pump permease subunit [Spelaeicoccus albus]
MNIDWAALGLVAVVTIIGALVLVAALSAGFAAMATAAERRQSGTNAALPTAFGGFFLVFSAALVLYGLYLIIPALHG